jgi:DNA-binding response OmpR family regulator
MGVPMQNPVLVVEDDEETSVALVELLRLEGIGAIRASDGAAAIDLFHEGLRPSIIVLDLMMPILSGEQFLRARRLSRELSRVPVLVVTAKAVAPEEFVGMNVSAVLRKPVDPEQMIEAVRVFWDGPA